MKLIRRENYLKTLLDVYGTSDIKIITGIRRAGKSKLLEMFRDEILMLKPSVNIIHINFNLAKFSKFANHEKLYEFVSNHYVTGKDNVLLIDEVQMCKNFELVINWLHAEEKYDIYITGSNAFLLSSDLATLFTGRNFSVEVFPFSFREFMQYFEYEDADKAFNLYLEQSGMAGSYAYPESRRQSYIRDVIKTLIVRDLVDKYAIKNQGLLERLLDFAIDNIGNLISSNTVANFLNVNSETTNHVTIGKYLGYLVNAFAFYKVRRYDIRGKKYLASNDKYYLADHGFRKARLGTKNLDYGRVLENIVAIELLRRGYEIYVGMLYQTEIDFVAKKGDEQIYIQVAYNIDYEETLLRELTPLLKICDAFPKMIVARTHQPTYTREGVTIVDVANWLEEK